MTAEPGADVLVVEDNPITRRLFRMALEGEGWAVREAPGGMDAIRLFRERRPGLLLTDFVLPDMEGTALVESIRRLPGGADLPVLLVTGLVSRIQDLREGLRGPAAILEKPVSPARLVEAAAAFLGPPQPGREVDGRLP